MSTNKLREALTAEFINSLQEDKLPWSAMWKTSRPYNAINGKPYRGINSLWLSYRAAKMGYDDPRWCTFKQAQDKGWSINKGEKGSNIEFWSLRDSVTKKTYSAAEVEAIIIADPSREKDFYWFSSVYTVFNGKQITGIPVLEKDTNSLDIESIKGQRETLFKNMKLSFSEGGDQAYYMPSSDRVVMPQITAFQNEYDYMSVLLHECGHATGHKSRLDRNIENTFGTDAYAREELRAEIASAFTAQELGFGAENASLSVAMNHHKAYIQSWVQNLKEKPDELIKAIQDATKISDYLIEKGEFKQLQEKRDKEQATTEPLQKQEHIKTKSR